MKRTVRVFLALGVALAFCFAGSAATLAQEKKPAKKFEKYGEDLRAKEWKTKKWTTSDKTFSWRASDPWGGTLLHDTLVHFADSVRACSGGRLDIKVFQTGAIVPAMEIFEATSKGVLDCAHSFPHYWKGRDEAFVAFGAIPFGLDPEGYNIWLYERGGKEMLNKLYGQYNMVAFPCGNTAQELGIHSNRAATKMEDFKGMKVRTVGWYQDILNKMGASVTPLPGPEIYLALERGVIDGCEFSGPAINYPMGFHEITKYIIEPGVHQPSSQCEIIINKKKWDELPDDLKAIVEICAKETQLWSVAWFENLNIKAVEEMAKKAQFIRMDDATIVEFAKTTKAYLDELGAKNPELKKVLDSQEQFKKDFAPWRKIRGGVAPWPIESVIKGELYQ